MRLRDRAPSSPRISIYKGLMLWHVRFPGNTPFTGVYASYSLALREVRRFLRVRAIQAIQDGAA